jgi:hypothetical protein
MISDDPPISTLADPPSPCTQGEGRGEGSSGRPEPALPTVWGLSPIQLYLRYWASLGVQVVRLGEPSQIISHAELFLLTDPRPLVLFRLSELMRILNWMKPLVLSVRLTTTSRTFPRQKQICDAAGGFLRWETLDAPTEESLLKRVALTPDIELGRLWQSAPDVRAGWRRLRRFTRRDDRLATALPGRVYDQRGREELALFTRDLLATWRRPDSIVSRARGWGAAAPWGSDIWRDEQGTIESGADLVGPVWVGCGRRIAAGATVIGPQVLWDDSHARPAIEPIQWLEIEPAAVAPQAVHAENAGTGRERIAKKLARLASKLARS